MDVYQAIHVEKRDVVTIVTPPFFLEVVTSQFSIGASGCFRLDGTHNLPCLGRSDFASSKAFTLKDKELMQPRNMSWCCLKATGDRNWIADGILGIQKILQESIENLSKSLKILEDPWKSLKILKNWLSGKFNWLISWGSQRFSSAYDNWMGFSCHAQRPLSFWLHHQASSSRQKQPVNSANQAIRFYWSTWRRYDMTYHTFWTKMEWGQSDRRFQKAAV